MSSPLSNLKKPKKAPFTSLNQGSRPVPFRKTDPSVSDTSLLDDVSSEMASKRLPRVKDALEISETSRKKRTSNPQKTSTSSSTSLSSAPSDQELMTLMMTRVAQLEQKVQQQSKEIAEKDKTLKILEDKLKILQSAKEGNNHNKASELEQKCLLLQQQVYEMETFLADYGMVWTGDKVDPQSDLYNEAGFPTEESNFWKPESSVPKYIEFFVDYDMIVENIRELNVLAGEGISKIQHTIDGARLKIPDAIPLTLFANGIFLFSGPFRPFSDLVTQQFITDLMDGYFPSELQQRYPDGVPIAVSDKRRTLFRDPRNLESFQGVGQVLGGEAKPSRLVQSNLQEKASPTLPPHDNVTSEFPGSKLTVEQFLNKLPSSVIKQGRVIDIRSTLSETLQSDGTTSSKVKLVETEAVQEMKSRMEQEESKRPPSSRDVTTLRIKSDQDNQTYILKMKFSQTIGDVKKHLDESRPRGAPPYEIVSAFPSQVYSDQHATLKQCGLVPNAALHLRGVKKSANKF